MKTVYAAFSLVTLVAFLTAPSAARSQRESHTDGHTGEYPSRFHSQSGFLLINAPGNDGLDALASSDLSRFIARNRVGGLHSAIGSNIHRAPEADLGGDSRKDLGAFRSSERNRYVLSGATNSVGVQRFGLRKDKRETGDNDTDSRTDTAVLSTVNRQLLNSEKPEQSCFDN